MTKNYQTEQEHFWVESFGDAYIERNNSETLLASNTAFFSDCLKNTEEINTVMEFGANVGLNLRAINQLLPSAILNAVEINKKAFNELRSWLDEHPMIKGDLHHSSLLEYEAVQSFDLVLSKTFLIHLNPERILEVYEKIYESAKKYILIAEYYSPAPTSILYRAHEGKLFKRDFAGDMLEIYSDLVLKNYGFVYHRDLAFPQDDINWFLLERVR